MVDACISIAGVLPPAEMEKMVKPALLGLVEDKSWRVRFMVAEKFTEVLLHLTITATSYVISQLQPPARCCYNINSSLYFQVQQALGMKDEAACNDVVIFFTGLLKDAEGEVRGAAAAKIERIIFHSLSILTLFAVSAQKCTYCSLQNSARICRSSSASRRSPSTCCP